MTRFWEDYHDAVRSSRATSGFGMTSNSAAAVGQAMSQAFEVNLNARGDEPPVPRMDPNKRPALLEEMQGIWPGLPLREVNIPGPRYMDQIWNDRRPGTEFKYYDWKQVTSVAVEKEIKKKTRAKNLSDSSWQERMLHQDLPQRDNVPSSQFQVSLLFEIRRNCHTLRGWCRHDIFQEYDTKCLDMFTARYDAALRERPPNLTEFLG